MKTKIQVIDYRKNFIIAQQIFKYIKLKTPHRYIYNVLSTQKKIPTSLGWVGFRGWLSDYQILNLLKCVFTTSFYVGIYIFCFKRWFRTAQEGLTLAL